RDDSQGEACPTDSGFIADQDKATIAKSSTFPRDSAPRVTSPAAEEGSMQQTINELTAFCTSLQRQHSELISKFQAQEVEINRLKDIVKILEDKEGVIGDKSGDDAPIKGRSNNEGEAAAERISNDSKEIARVLTSIDAATVLAGETNVPTGSGFIPTAGPPTTVISTGSEVGPTASPIVQRRKGKEIMVESDTPKKKKLQEQIDAQVEDFIPISSKEEAERVKRKGINLEKEQVKKQKSSEEAPETKTPTEEFTEDKIKEMMQLVPVEDVYVQAVQVKHPIIDWKVHSEEKDYPLRRGLALIMISYRLQVENHSQMAEDLIKKIYNIANTPRKQSIDALMDGTKRGYQELCLGELFGYLNKKDVLGKWS
nr:hypothetical protein [Tanacetum cinerariifolium]